MGRPSAAQLIPLMSKLGGYFKEGIDHYAMLKASGLEASPEILTAFIEAKMADWDPTVRGVSLLDSDTKEAASRLLAGIVYNLSSTSPQP